LQSEDDIRRREAQLPEHSKVRYVLHTSLAKRYVVIRRLGDALPARCNEDSFSLLNIEITLLLSRT
jgi:hypothetical protein